LLLGLKGQLWVTSSDRLPQTTSGDKQVHAVAMASSGSGGAHGIGSVASPPALAAYAALLLCEWTFSPLSECLEDPVAAVEACAHESAVEACAPESTTVEACAPESTSAASPGLPAGVESRQCM
jgi:hypothetical protein